MRLEYSTEQMYPPWSKVPTSILNLLRRANIADYGLARTTDIISRRIIPEASNPTSHLMQGTAGSRARSMIIEHIFRALPPV